MAPIRRYVRITKYSVLECRIFLDDPTLSESWLLNPRTAVLARVMKSVFPLITPKLREEYERSKGKSTKKSRIKDLVVEDDFDVTVFLTDSRSRHSLLTKQKHFYNPQKKEIRSNSSKLLGSTTNSVDNAITIEEEPNNSDLCLHDIPEADKNISIGSSDEQEESGQQVSKRVRDTRSTGSSSDAEPLPKRKKNEDDSCTDEQCEEKKMAIRTTYEGFTIYGRVLCLIVRRRDRNGKGPPEKINQATMENWISSTQPPPENEEIA